MRNSHRLNLAIAAAFFLSALGAQAATTSPTPLGTAATQHAKRHCKDSHGKKVRCDKSTSAAPH